LILIISIFYDIEGKNFSRTKTTNYLND